MRSPTVLGVVAALASGTILLVLLLAAIGGQPPAAPTPGAPSAPPLELETPLSPSPGVPAGTSPAAPTSAPSGLLTPPPEGLGIGQRAPHIRLPLLDGGTLDTADYRGRPVWINFMATWCPQCQDELPMMESMQAQLGEQLSVILVDVGEDRRTVARFMNRLNVQLPTAIDRDGAVQQLWGAYALPVHYWLDSEGVVQARLFGGAPRELFIESIRAVIPDAEVE